MVGHGVAVWPESKLDACGSDNRLDACDAAALSDPS
jgi:hypothetical protein